MMIEEKFQFFFEQMVDLAFLVEWKDNTLWYTKVNRSAQQKLGVEMVGKKLIDVLPESTFRLLEMKYLECISKKESINYIDLNLFVPDMPASETTLTPIIDDEKFYVLAITRDVSEFKMKSEDYIFLHSLVANTVDAMLVLDTNGKILKINDAFNTNFGWTHEEMVGRNWYEFLFTPNELKAQANAIFISLNQGKTIPNLETIRLTKNGDPIHTSVSFSTITDEQNKIVAHSMIYRNIEHLVELEKKLAESKEAYKSLFSYHKNAILMLDTNGVIQKCNDASETLTGFKKEDIIGRNLGDFVNAQLDLQNNLLQRAIEGQVNSYEVDVSHASGSILNFYVTQVPIIVKGDVTGVYIIAQDITEKKAMEHALKDSEEKFRLITEHSSDLIKVLDKDGVISYVSPSYRMIFGENYESILGKDPVYGVHKEDQKLIQKAIEQLYKSEESLIIEYKYIDYLGNEIWVEVNGNSILGEGALDQIILTGRIISERKQLQEKLTFQAYHDSLTNLPNRRNLEQELEKAIACAQNDTGKLALLFLDCDKFKEINDTFGHDVGDLLLVHLSNRLKDCVRSEDIVARLGGDEFVILLKYVEDTEQVLKVANRIRESLEKPYNLDGNVFQATTSIGISVYPTNGTTTKELFRKADQALYNVKNSGRNNYQLYK
ncbi:PAS domain S-box protein [Sutcliffiella halmapala]|uniref:PAS domain S-box protein n=1 Tax=Sutcliffiella halmapala TaxID=79882 RepID=UPI00099523CE|nr:PAS domain S-box protein [Sutcliffiella halmapala]